VIVRFWQDWTGKTATGESDGVAFGELVAGSNGGLEATDDRADEDTKQPNQP